MTLLVRYCGGCNPGFDRVAIVQALLAELPPDITVTHGKSDAHELSLAINGCARRCVEGAELVLDSPAQKEDVLRVISQKMDESRVSTIRKG